MERKKLEGLPFHRKKLNGIDHHGFKDKDKHWIIAGAKHLIYAMPRDKQWLGLHE
jgi:hypothetical protein